MGLTDGDEVVGLVVGADVVGLVVGDEVVGVCVGADVVGLWVGEREGLVVGDDVVGEEVGLDVVGLTVGEVVVGLVVGDCVGANVAAHWQMPSSCPVKLEKSIDVVKFSEHPKGSKPELRHKRPPAPSRTRPMQRRLARAHTSLHVDDGLKSGVVEALSIRTATSQDSLQLVVHTLNAWRPPVNDTPVSTPLNPAQAPPQELLA